MSFLLAGGGIVETDGTTGHGLGTVHDLQPGRTDAEAITKGWMRNVPVVAWLSMIGMNKASRFSLDLRLLRAAFTSPQFW